MGKNTVVASFSDRQQAEKAVDQLQQQGFKREDISILAKQDQQTQNNQQQTQISYDNQNLADGTSWGAGIGAGTGLLASAGALAIPGIGPLLALGPIAATLGGAAVGGLAGGLVDYGIPRSEGQQIEERVSKGEILAMVETEQPQKAEEIFRSNGANDVRSFPRD